MAITIEDLEKRKEILKRKNDEINNKIKKIKSRERLEQKKKETHYKILLGAYFINKISNNGIDENTKNNLKAFINNDDKYNAILEFINTQKNHQTDNQ